MTPFFRLTLALAVLAGPAGAQTFAPAAPVEAPAAAAVTALPGTGALPSLVLPSAGAVPALAPGLGLQPLAPLPAWAAPSNAAVFPAGPSRPETASARGPDVRPAAGGLDRLRRADLAPFSPGRLGRSTSEEARGGFDAAWSRLLGESVPAGLNAVEGGRGVRRPRRSPAASPGPLEAGALAAVKDGLGRWKTPKPEGEFYSPNSLKNFEFDPEDYALHYLFGVKKGGPVGYPFAVGLAVHQTLELAFTAIEKGADPRSLGLDDALRAYDVLWAGLLKEQAYAPDGRFTQEDFRRRGRRFIERRWPTVSGFTGKVESLETALRYSITDPVTGKAYAFVGIPDRVSVDGETFRIHDWKTYYNPPSIEQLKREDYQLGVYVLGMMSLFPEKLQGKKVIVSWDYKEFSQELEVTPEFLEQVQDRVLRVLHGVEVLKRRVEGERADWEKRARPDAKPAGLAGAKAAVDEAARLDAKMRLKRGQLKAVRAAQREKEAGLRAFAASKGLARIEGERNVLELETETGPKVPTATDNEAGHEAVVRALKDGGAWERYSTLDYGALKEAAEVNGHPHHRELAPVLPKLRQYFENELAVEPRSAAPGRRGGVKPLKLYRAPAPDEEPEPGLYSASKIGLYVKDPKAYALQYILGVKPDEAKSYGILTGLAIHETLEALFDAIKGGRPPEELSLAEAIDFYRRTWAEREKEGDYRAPRGSKVKREDFIRGGEDYLRAKWSQLHPFTGLGEVVYLERRLHFSLKDPETGKVFRFQGIPDRVMVKDGVVEIHDWKTHMVPKTEAELREEDFQLALYTVALRQLYPGLMKGRKVRLIWDFKEAKDVVTIEADDAYVEGAVRKVLDLMLQVERFTAEVERDAAKWEALAGAVKRPAGPAEARRWVDELARLKALEKERKAELEELEARRAEAAARVIAFQRATGWWRLETARNAATLRKIPVTEVPTKTGPDAAANAEIVRLLKQAGVWDRYSKLDYPALKKALAAETHADRAVLDKIRALLETVTETKAKLKPL